MRDKAYTFREIDQLALLASEGVLSDEQTVTFNDMVLNHPKARRRIARHFYLQSYLKEELESVELVSDKKAVAYRPWLMAAAAVLLFVFCVTWLVWPNHQSQPVNMVERAYSDEEKGVAVLGRQVGVVWGKETTLPMSSRQLRIPLEPCVLEIEEGVLQIDFYHGATVLLEGPARFEVVNSWQGRLAYGKLSAEVPPAAVGFEVSTDGFKVVDLGTAFAMKVDRSGGGEVHVFEGEVEMRRDGESEEMLLKKGQAASIQAGKVKEGQARPQKFTRLKSLDRKVEEKIARSNKMRKQLAEDPEMLLYYSFSGAEEWVRRVKNEAKLGPKDTDGAVVGCHSAPGRWPGTQALGFSRSSDRVRVNLPGEYKNLSMMMWVRVYDVPGDRVALMNPEVDQAHFMHWNIIESSLGKNKQLHFSATDKSLGALKGREHYHCQQNIHEPLSGGKWAHLALIHDTDNREVRHYVNGELIGQNEITVLRPLQVGIVDLGNWPQKRWAKGTEFEVRNLVGSMGEFLVAKRVFNGTEIKAVYEAGKP